MSIVDCTDADLAFLCNFKIALAAAIVRSKPIGLSGKEYATILAKKIAKTEETWRHKAKELEEKLLESKQQNVYLRLKNELAEINKETEKGTNQQPSHDKDAAVNCNGLKEDQVNENVQCMKTMVALKWHSLSNSVRSRIDSDNVVKESIMMSIQEMTRSVRKLELNNRMLDALEESSRYVIELLEGVIFCHDLGIQEIVLKLVEELIRTIMNQKALASYNTRDRLSKLAASLAAVPLVIDLVVSKLSILIKTYSEVLLDHQKKRTVIQVDKFENICFVFRIMEQILRSSSTEILRNAKETICELMPENMFKLTNTFPMFVHYVWKLKAIIETGDMYKQTQETSLWKEQEIA